MIAISHCIKTVLTVAGLFILTTIASLDAQAAPLALEPSTNEEVWIKVPSPVAIDWYEDSCRYDHTEYRTFKDYENCIFKSLAQADNLQSRKWGLSDRVIREKDTIYINTPNHKQPLVFKDYLEPFEEEYRAHYQLQDYDKSHHLLQLLRTMYETQATVIVDLNTGRWQELYATNLKFSSDMNQVVGFNGRQGVTRDIIIWERQKADNDGRYATIFASNELYEQDYDNDKKHEVYEARDISWTSDNKVNVDFYYRVNPTDTVAFRVRYIYAADNKEGKWQRVLPDVNTND
ncbi:MULTISPECIES: hypothetical protein [unclassified Psychrobacter]|uniref:hypothetical protein n=1 Tax=unclassified Psychrobacter TaxID=196806 RepID=UPI000EF09720|nr:MULTISPECIES: hypothetical protein [unclassified Psychrobacter]MBE8609349.1 hypothetical protein [Pseudomonas lundensis]HCI74837.1 hypothetical protein [Psychrobacter sp.]